MYAVIVFALVLLSPMPFVSPFGHIVQDVAAQSPFGPFEPTTSPSFIIEPNAQAFELRSSFIHSPAGTIGFTNPNTLDISIIDNHTYVLTDSDNDVIITNITNIASPTMVSDITGFDGTRLSNIVIDNSTYAIGVGGFNDLHIANISDIANPDFFPTHNLGRYAYGLTTVFVNQSAYALVGHASGILIVNITSPNNAGIVHNIEKNNGYAKLNDVYGLAAITIGESVYALATNARYNVNNYGLTIIDITNTSSPFLVSNETLGTGRSFYLDTVTIDESIYAIVMDQYSLVSIINITNPYSPELASAITNNNDGYTRLFYPRDITTVTLGESTFALVTDQAFTPGVQIIDITNPYAPSPASALNNGQNYNLSQVAGIVTVTQDEQTYALISSIGTDAILVVKLEYTTLISLTSNNTNPAYATIGDTLELEFSATDTIHSTGNVAILGDTVRSASPIRDICGRFVSTKMLDDRSSSVTTSVVPAVSLTSTIKFAYLSISLEGTDLSA